MGGTFGRGAYLVSMLTGALGVEATFDELGAVDREIIVCRLSLLRMVTSWYGDMIKI